MSSFILSPVSNQVTIGCSPGFEDLEKIVHLIPKKAETLDFSANFLSKFSLIKFHNSSWTQFENTQIK